MRLRVSVCSVLVCLALVFLFLGTRHPGIDLTGFPTDVLIRPVRSRSGARPGTTLALVGDVMLGRGVAQSLDGDWEAAFAAVRPWLTLACGPAEPARVVAFANLESPLTSAPQVGAGYDLRAPPEAVSALSAAGFDLVSLANNHALDAGQAGLQDTVSALHAAGITALTDASTTPQFPDHQSTDYQFTTYQSTIHQPTIPPSTTLQFLAFDDSTASLDVASAAEAVAAAARRAGGVVVSIHWGGEYQAAPGPRQRDVAGELARAGADVIVGHGPHVLQRAEWLGETLVAYSLGNFLFDQPYPADCRWGAVLRVVFQGDRIVAVDALPTVVEQGRVRPAGPEDAAAILARLGVEAAPAERRAPTTAARPTSNLQPPASNIQHPKFIIQE